MLLSVGEFLKSKIRGADVACRYGGEEFILFLPEATLDVTLKRMQGMELGLIGPYVIRTFRPGMIT